MKSVQMYENDEGERLNIWFGCPLERMVKGPHIGSLSPTFYVIGWCGIQTGFHHPPPPPPIDLALKFICYIICWNVVIYLISQRFYFSRLRYSFSSPLAAQGFALLLQYISLRLLNYSGMWPLSGPQKSGAETVALVEPGWRDSDIASMAQCGLAAEALAWPG